MCLTIKFYLGSLLYANYCHIIIIFGLYSAINTINGAEMHFLHVYVNFAVF